MRCVFLYPVIEHVEHSCGWRVRGPSQVRATCRTNITERTKINHASFFVFFSRCKSQMKLKEAQLHKAKLRAKKSLSCILQQCRSSLSKFLYRTIPGSSNAFSSNLAERLITAHYFKEIFLLYFMNITAR